MIYRLQGDVIGYDTNGTKVVEYAYDAWDNCTVVSDSNGYGARNPIRYSGYYFDTDLNMYYLTTRYYNPKTGRFINADSIEYLKPDAINGLNLYAYCGNNPVMYVDHSGCFPWLAAVAAILLFTPVGGLASQPAVSALSYAGIAVASLFDEDIKNDMDKIGWNPFNDDEDSTLSSEKVSFYKGVPVFRTDLDRSGSFYAIFLRTNYSEQEKYDALNHERGHNTQAMMMGIFNYLFTVGIPSPLKLGYWAENDLYYDAPWEEMANILGGVNHLSTQPESSSIAWEYYWKSVLFFPLVIEYWL